MSCHLDALHRRSFHCQLDKSLGILPIGIAKQAVKEGLDVVSGRGVKSNVPMMMSDSHFTSARFQVTGDRRKRRMKNGNFTSFRDASVEKIFRFKRKNFVNWQD
jgi:hypothetical protein